MALWAISLIWLMGFGFRMLQGCDAREATLKATACALSAAIGCCVYLLAWWPPSVNEIPRTLFFMSVVMIFGT